MDFVVSSLMQYSDLIPPLITLVASFVGAWLAARFALSRYYREKVWDRKTAAYTDIFDALYGMEQLFRTQLRDLTTQISGSSDRQLSDEEEAQLKAQYEDAESTLRRRLARESWLIPDTIRLRIEDALIDLERASHITGWAEQLLAGNRVIDALKQDLRGPISSDLRMRSFRSPRVKLTKVFR
jgi:hypothetical protein